ncbi:MAG: hypothetical protein F4137_15570 [Acidobacteria bacterium]|nr:hypothetical protein [Acidobacteriota bacterium]
MTAQAATRESAERVSRCVTALLREQPFFGSLALRLPIRADDARETLASDGREIRYAPDWVARTDAHAVEAAIARVVLACALKHHTRRGARDPERWQRASQLVTHGMLRDAGFTLPPDAEAWDGISVEEAYDRLPEPEPDTSGDGGADDENGGHSPDDDAGGTKTGLDDSSPGSEDDDADDASGDSPEGDGGNLDGPDQADGSGDGEGDDSDGDTGPDCSGADPEDGDREPDDDGPGQDDGSRQGGDDNGTDGQSGPEKGGQHPDGEDDGSQSRDPAGTGEVMDAPAGVAESGDGDAGPSARDIAAEEQAWDEAMHQAASLAKAEGRMPGAVEETVRGAHAGTLDWRTLLRRFMTDAAKRDYSWSVPNHRFIDGGLYLPSIRSDGIETIAFIIDVSSSLPTPTLAAFWAELREVAAEIRPESVIVLQVDTVLQDAAEHSADDLPDGIVVKGRGGTDYRPGFAWLEEQGIEPGVCLYFTDMECSDYPDAEPAFPVLWILSRARDRQNYFANRPMWRNQDYIVVGD